MSSTTTSPRIRGMKTCPTCTGLGLVGPGVSHGNTAYVYCQCAPGAKAFARISACGIPKKLAQATVSGYKPDPRYPSQAAAKETIRHWVEEFQRPCMGLLLYGPPGTGKTHLAIAALRAVINKGYTGECWHVAELLEQQRLGSFASAEERSKANDDFISASLSCDLLLLDDLGVERGTEFEKTRLALLLDRRDRIEAPVIVTANYKPEDLQNLIDPRTYSRLMGMCEPVLVDGPDYRRRRASR